MSLPRPDGRQRGQVLVLAVLALAALLGASALAVDYGRWVVERRDYQNVVDGAVLAGAGHLGGASDSERVAGRAAAWDAIKRELGLTLDPLALAATSTGQGAPYQEAGYRIWVDSPATDAGADYHGAVGSTWSMFARVERNDPSFFGRALGVGDANVGAWATAGRNSTKYAIEVLCPMGDKRCPGNVRDLKIAGGTQGFIRVLDGDVASNWGLQVTSQSAPGLIIEHGNAYLMELKPGSDWSPPPAKTGGVNRGAKPLTANIWPLQLTQLIPVPDWELPAWIDVSTGAACETSGCVPLRADFTCSAPAGNVGGNNGNGKGGGGNGGGTGGGGNGQVSCGTIVNATSTSVTCGPTAPHLAPGTYDTVDVKGGCLILDPAPAGYRTCTETAGFPVASTIGLCRGQTPGIFHIRKSLTIGQGQTSAFIVGDGVSIVLDDSTRVSVGNSSGMVIGTGNTQGDALPVGATGWTSQGDSPWPPCTAPGSSATLDCVPDSSYGVTGTSGLAVAIYVRPPGVADLRQGCGSQIGKLTMNGSFGIQFQGAFFAPCHDLALGASPYQGSVGAVFSWTLNYNGQAQLEIAASGPAILSPPFLLEPTLFQ